MWMCMAHVHVERLELFCSLILTSEGVQSGDCGHTGSAIIAISRSMLRRSLPWLSEVGAEVLDAAAMCMHDRRRGQAHRWARQPATCRPGVCQELLAASMGMILWCSGCMGWMAVWVMALISLVALVTTTGIGDAP